MWKEEYVQSVSTKGISRGRGGSPRRARSPAHRWSPPRLMLPRLHPPSLHSSKGMSVALPLLGRLLSRLLVLRLEAWWNLPPVEAAANSGRTGLRWGGDSHLWRRDDDDPASLRTFHAWCCYTVILTLTTIVTWHICKEKFKILNGKIVLYSIIYVFRFSLQNW
jgi:hypothetical protein